MMKRFSAKGPAKYALAWLGGDGGNAAGDAATQFEFNQRAAELGQQLNRYNVSSPTGSQVFSKGPDGTQTLTERFSPRQKKIFRQREKADFLLAQQAHQQAQQSGEFMNRHAGELSNLRDSELSAATSRSGVRGRLLQQIGGQKEFDPSAEFMRQGVDNLSDVSEYGSRQQDLGRESVENALFARLNPQFQRDQEGAEARLAAQGVSPGSEAYMRAMDELNRSKTDARNQVVLAGGQEQSRIAGLRGSELQRRQSLRDQVLQEMLARRRLPQDELAAIEQ